jgi:hypothetical protein
VQPETSVITVINNLSARPSVSLLSSCALPRLIRAPCHTCWSIPVGTCSLYSAPPAKVTWWRDIYDSDWILSGNKKTEKISLWGQFMQITIFYNWDYSILCSFATIFRNKYEPPWVLH